MRTGRPHFTGRHESVTPTGEASGQPSLWRTPERSLCCCSWLSILTRIGLISSPTGYSRSSCLSQAFWPLWFACLLGLSPSLPLPLLGHGCFKRSSTCSRQASPEPHLTRESPSPHFTRERHTSHPHLISLRYAAPGYRIFWGTPLPNPLPNTHTKRGGGRSGDQSETLVSVRVPLIKETETHSRGSCFPSFSLRVRYLHWVSGEDSSFNDLSSIFDDLEKCITSQEHHWVEASVKNTESSRGLHFTWAINWQGLVTLYIDLPTHPSARPMMSMFQICKHHSGKHRPIAQHIFRVLNVGSRLTQHSHVTCLGGVFCVTPRARRENPHADFRQMNFPTSKERNRHSQLTVSECLMLTL